MAIQILAFHWKAVRWGLLPFVVAAFALPLLSVQGVETAPSSPVTGAAVLATVQMWAPLFPLVAAGLGILLALSAWNWDHQGEHVYALTLPVSRWEYALLKLGAGVVLALVPAVALLAGALAASWSVALPPGLHAYPLDLAARFLLSTVLAYALLFALASGTVRTTTILLSCLVAAPVVAGVALDFLTPFYPALGRIDVVEVMIHALARWPGPLAIFTGNWMLIDV